MLTAQRAPFLQPHCNQNSWRRVPLPPPLPPPAVHIPDRLLNMAGPQTERPRRQAIALQPKEAPENCNRQLRTRLFYSGVRQRLRNELPPMRDSQVRLPNQGYKDKQRFHSLQRVMVQVPRAGRLTIAASFVWRCISESLVVCLVDGRFAGA